MSSAGTAASVKKIVVAVHGIGDQVRNETILSTAIRFCDFYGYEGMVSLGAFHAFPPALGTQPVPEPALFIDDPPPFQPCAGLTGTIGFVEVHWADVARKTSDEEHTLQEAKSWARSIVNRVRVYATHRNAVNANIDYRRIGQVLEEVIDSIRVIESLLFLSAKAGLGEFKLRKILDGFLGDVQLVTEFAPVREVIVQRFTDVMRAIEAKYPNAEIYIVSHSEGTVVSFLGLLEADLASAQHRWLQQVRGFMTLGSPIDKHLILWPRLFDRYKGPAAGNRNTIRWVNYVDYADPVGFNLDTARDWLRDRGYSNPDHQYAPLFAFDPAEDYSFRRYPIPGKAHVDYWQDPEVFGHFIKLVVAPPAQPLPPDEAASLKAGPRSLWWVPLVTYGVGYLIPLAILHLGVYVLCKAIYGYFDPSEAKEHPNFVTTVLAVSWLVAGATVWLRIVRLTRTWGWFVLGMLLYATFAGGYAWLVSRMTQPPGSITELSWFEEFARGLDWPLGRAAFVGSLVLIALVLLVNASFWRRALRGISR